MNTNQFIVELESPFDVPATVEKLIEAAGNRGWQNPATHNLQNSLAKSGREVLPVQVVEICKPEFSGKMLELNDERVISILMPCRISVYEKNDGKTYIAMLNMSEMSVGMPDNMTAAINGASDETFGIVESVIHS